MAELVWVADAAVLAIHQRQLAEHGGQDGVRDLGLLESALARPKHVFAYHRGADLARFAAAYAFGIAKNHPFLDGNKRTAFVVCRTFLKLNGHDIQARVEEKYLALLQLADGTFSEEEFASWVRECLVTDVE